MSLTRAKRQKDIWILMGVHALLAFILPAIFFLILAGCTKDLSEEPVYLGPEVSQEKILDALLKAWENTSPYDMQKGEGVHHKVTNWVETAPGIPAGDVFQFVLDRKDTSEAIEIMLRRCEITIDKEGNREVSRRDQPLLLPPPEQVQSLAAPKAIELLQGKLQQLHGESKAPLQLAATAESKITYHNLKMDSYETAPPKVIRERSDCNGIPDCKIKVTELSYDVALWEGKDFIKQHFAVVLTDQMTWLSRFVEECTKYMIYTEERSYLLRSCSELYDFTLNSSEENQKCNF